MAVENRRKLNLLRPSWSQLLARVKQTPEIGVALALTVIVIIAMLTITAKPMYSTPREHLGGEYFQLARALVEGRGYSDPFAERTGPTAWMPPLYSTVMAFIMLFTDSRTVVSFVVVGLTGLTIVAMGTTVYGILRRCQTWIPPVFGAALSVAWVIVLDYWFLVITTDVWILCLLWVFAAILIFRAVWANTMNSWAWGVLGGVAALASPAQAFAIGMMFAGLAFNQRLQPKRWLIAAGLAAAITAPWVVRNAVVFGTFIPTKSNLYYELYTANIYDDDGVYDGPQMAKHPYVALDARFRYARFGEQKYLEGHRRVFLRDGFKKPDDLLRRVQNRALAATVVYPALTEGGDGGHTLLMRRVFYAAPWVVFLASIWISGRHRRLLAWCGLACGVFLLPYVLIAFYARYSMPLAPMYILVTCLGLDQLAHRLFAKQRVTSENSSENSSEAVSEAEAMAQ